MFIVIEGLDGAGKSTQTNLIKEAFLAKGIKTKYLHFPRFDSPIYGELIAKFLRGELGELDNVNPYLVALLYAGDRADASKMIEQWLKDGYAVVVDRYVYSNIAYQCAKCDTPQSATMLRDWILNLEYNENCIVKPDKTIFLDVPFEFTKNKLTQEREGDDRDYLNGKKDIHEASLSFQERVRLAYHNQLELDSNLHIVNCGGEDGNMLPPEKIFAKIKKLIF